MDNFNEIWEVEYLCARVRMISDSVKEGSYESAKDMLSILQEKAKAAEYIINNKNKKWFTIL